MLQLLPTLNPLNYLLLLLAALTATVIGFSAIRHIFCSSAKDEPNFEDDDSIYAFYGGARKYQGARRAGIKRVAFDM